MKSRYSNPYIRNIRRTIKDFILWKFGYYDDLLPSIQPPEDFSYPTPGVCWDQDKPHVTWVNHCTFLIEYESVRILTDPIWSDRCSPIPFLGPKRRHDPAIPLSDLGSIDIVLISHNHYDHLDESTVRWLNRAYPNLIWYVPKGVKKWFTKRKIHHVKELRWWEESLLNLGPSHPQIQITSVPAQHNSGRSFFDVNQSLWMGFVVEIESEKNGRKSFYFAGDTAYNPYDFKKIGDRFSKIDLSMCPIGTYKPSQFMRTVHSSPTDAVNIHLDIGAELSVGMHWRTFRLSSEHMEQPPYDLYQEMRKRGLNPHKFIPLEPGESINW